MARKLRIKPFKQLEGYCGPACLKMVFEYYGVNTTGNAIAKIAGSTHEFGTPLASMKKAAKAYGFSLTHKDNSSLKDIRHFLDKGIPVIVDWFSEIEGHYSIVTNIDKTHIHLVDPELGKHRSIPLNIFIHVWFDLPFPYAKTKSDFWLRRLIIVQPMKH